MTITPRLPFNYLHGGKLVDFDDNTLKAAKGNLEALKTRTAELDNTADDRDGRAGCYPVGMKIETSNILHKAARVRFADTPGTVTFEDGWVRDHATLQVMAPASQVGSLLEDMRHLAQDAGVPFREQDVDIKRSEFKSAVTTDVREYYIASYRVPVKNAQEQLRALVADHADTIQSVEMPGR